MIIGTITMSTISIKPSIEYCTASVLWTLETVCTAVAQYLTLLLCTLEQSILQISQFDQDIDNIHGVPEKYRNAILHST